MTERVNIIGTGVSAITLESAVEAILGWRDLGEQNSVSTCTAHTLVEAQRDRALRDRINRANIATPDGMPLVWLCRAAGHPQVTRVYGPDLMLALCESGCASRLRHYFYGGAEGVPESLAADLTRRFPDLQVAGTYSPPYRPLSPDEDAAIIELINATRPDIVWVGLGTPKQDFWVADHRGKINAAALIAVGAAFDFHSGRVKQAPLWIQRSGLEWLFRLIQEPRRLWKRYLVDNLIFVTHVALQRSKLRQYPIKSAG